MIRTVCLAWCLAALASLCGSDRTTPLTVEDLHGAWIVDSTQIKTEQQDAAKAAAAVEGYGITFTQRTCRVIVSEDQAFAGMWRIDAATPTTATIVIQPKGQEEHRVPISYDGKTLVLTDTAAKLPLIKAKR
jgi:hypothetical protein